MIFHGNIVIQVQGKYQGRYRYTGCWIGILVGLNRSREA